MPTQPELPRGAGEPQPHQEGVLEASTTPVDERHAAIFRRRMKLFNQLRERFPYDEDGLSQTAHEIFQRELHEQLGNPE